MKTEEKEQPAKMRPCFDHSCKYSDAHQHGYDCDRSCMTCRGQARPDWPGV